MKNPKSWLAAFACLGIGAVAIPFASTGDTQPTRPAVPDVDEVLPAAGEIRTLALTYDDRIARLEETLSGNREALHRLQEAIGDLATQVESARTPAVAPEPPPPPEPDVDRLLVMDLNPDLPPAGTRIPAGSFGEATLLTGVFAPIHGEPMPVLVRLDAVLTGPEGVRVPLRGAFLVGKAVGDANSARAVIQLTKLSLGEDDLPINGFLVDGDGVQGLQGRYIWNASQLAALSAVSGFARGSASALGDAEKTSLLNPFGIQQAVTGDRKRFATSAGASAALESLSKLIEERMQEFTPAVYAHNHKRRITVVFLESLLLPGVAEPASPFETNLGAFDR